jgi:hypothetical protein
VSSLEHGNNYFLWSSMVCSLSSCRELKPFPHILQLKYASTSKVDSSVSTIMINVQSHSSSTSGANQTGNTTGTGNGTTTSNETRVTHMGICVVGVRSPCNGNSNS